MAWTVSSRCGLITSNRPISVNSKGSNVGHQQMAKFFESMLFALQFSVTLRTKKGKVSVEHSAYHSLDNFYMFLIITVELRT